MPHSSRAVCSPCFPPAGPSTPYQSSRTKPGLARMAHVASAGASWALLKQGLAAALASPIFQMRRLRLGEEQDSLELCSILQWGGAGPWPCLGGPRLTRAGREGLCWNCGCG